MKIIVTHSSPDLDAITSVWLIKRFLPGWENSVVEFVPAGQRSPRSNNNEETLKATIEKVGDDEMIHVDTGLGPLDHHQTDDRSVCGASRSWDYVKSENPDLRVLKSDRMIDKTKAVDRMVKIVVDIDHFREVFWENPTADYHEFSFFGILEGLKLQKPNQDQFYADFGMECLDAILHNFENRLWAEQEIAENGTEFVTRYGRGIGFETLNDTVIKLVQKMGYQIVVRKDPRKGYVRIKARPSDDKDPKLDIDLTSVYEALKKMDPQASWFLHISKKMLLNGSSKNPDMRSTKLSLSDIIEVIESVCQ